MAATNIVFDQSRPSRIGNSVFGILTGQFVSANTINTTAFYADALGVVSPRFQTTPPPRIVCLESNTASTTFVFQAVGRVV